MRTKSAARLSSETVGLDGSEPSAPGMELSGEKEEGCVRLKASQRSLLSLPVALILLASSVKEAGLAALTAARKAARADASSLCALVAVGVPRALCWYALRASHSLRCSCWMSGCIHQCLLRWVLALEPTTFSQTARFYFGLFRVIRVIIWVIRVSSCMRSEL